MKFSYGHLDVSDEVPENFIVLAFQHFASKCVWVAWYLGTLVLRPCFSVVSWNKFQIKIFWFLKQ